MREEGVKEKAAPPEHIALADIIEQLMMFFPGVNCIQGTCYDPAKIRSGEIKLDSDAYNFLLAQSRDHVLRLSMGIELLLDTAREYIPKDLSKDKEQVRELSERAQITTSALLLKTILAELLKIRDKWLNESTYSKKLLRDYKEIASRLEQLAVGEDKEKVARFREAVELLSDPEKLGDYIVKLFLFFDLLHGDVYSEIRKNIRDEDLKILAQAYQYNLTLGNIDRIVHLIASVILPLRDKLDKAPDLWMTGNSAHCSDALDYLDCIKRWYNDRVNAIKGKLIRGEVPERSPTYQAMVTEVVSKYIGWMNPAKYVEDLLYAGFKSAYMQLNNMLSLFGIRYPDELVDQLAKYAAAAAHGAIVGAIGVFTPPVAVAYGVASLTASMMELLSTMADPVKAELVTKYLSEHWGEIAVSAVVGAVTAAGTALALRAYAPRIRATLYSKTADLVERFNPHLAAKLRDEAQLTIGRVVYESKDLAVTVEARETPEGVERVTLNIKFRGAGKLETLTTYEFKPGSYVLFTDDEAKTLLGTVIDDVKRIATPGTKVESVLNSILSYVDDLASTRGLDAAKEFLRSIRESIQRGGVKAVFTAGVMGRDVVLVEETRLVVYSPALKAPVEIAENAIREMTSSPDTFNLYWLAKSSGLDPAQVYSVVKDYATRVQVGKLVWGRVQLGNFVFQFAGDKVYIATPEMLAKYGLDLCPSISLKNFDSVVWFKIDRVVNSIVSNYGESIAHLVLNSLALGKGVASYNIPSLGVVMEHVVLDVPTYAVVDSLKGAAPSYGLVSQLVTKDGVLLVSRQVGEVLKGYGVSVDTAVVGTVVKQGAERLARVLGSWTVTLSKRALGYIGDARIKGGVTELAEAVKQAIIEAGKIGDTQALQELSMLYLTLKSAESTAAVMHIAYISSSEAVFSASAVPGISSAVLANAISSASSAIARGDPQSAYATLTNSLVQAGFSREVAELLAYRSLTGLPVVLSQTLTKTETLTAVEYERADITAVDKSRDVIEKVYVTKEVTDTKTTLIPASEFTQQTLPGGDKQRDTITKIPVIEEVTDTRTTLIPKSEYTPQTIPGSDMQRDTITKIPVVSEVTKTETTLIPLFEHELTLTYPGGDRFQDTIVKIPVISEVAEEKVTPVSQVDYEYEVTPLLGLKLTGQVYTVPVTVPVVQTVAIELEEGTGEPLPPGVFKAIPLPPPAPVAPRPALPGITPPRPRGRGELEEITI
jgi:plasmid stabilization system protein ParE